VTTLHRMMAVIATIGLAVVASCTESHAEPAAFPDLGAYTPVNVSDYAVELPNPPHDPTNAVYFLTPDGIPCNFHTGSVGCTGDIPGVQDKAKNPFTHVGTDSGIQATTSTLYGDATIQGHPISSLPPLHSIAAGGSICGADDAGTTACKDYQGRAFVISPQGTSWLPHV
jgi:hypothetical protein